MKKRNVIVIVTIMIILIFTLICLIVPSLPKTVLVNDGILATVIVDGETKESFPEEGAYNVLVSCVNATGYWNPEDWVLVIEDITGNVKCNIDFESGKKTLTDVVEKETTTNANGNRYSGKNPNNYIWFNNAMWRIIGSIPTKMEDGSIQNLVKIIKNESINGLAYDGDDNYTGAWGHEVTLYNLLNTHFYADTKEALNGQASTDCTAYAVSGVSNCDYREIGILSKSYYGKMVENVYWNTGASDNEITAELAYNNEIANQTVLGKVGLMNISDYGYAADSAYHASLLTSYNTKEVTSTNWLYNGAYEWSLTQYSLEEGAALRVGLSGASDIGYTLNGLQMRPVVYLAPEVYIVNGIGTEDSPYRIGMKIY